MPARAVGDAAIRYFLNAYVSFNARVEEASGKPMWRDAWEPGALPDTRGRLVRVAGGRARRSATGEIQAGEAAPFSSATRWAWHLFRGLDVLLEKPGQR